MQPMNRRSFLAMLGLAPIAAKISLDDMIVGNLSNAYDHVFTSSAILRPTNYQVIALQLEKVRHELPVLWETENSSLFELLSDTEPMTVSRRPFRLPIFPVLTQRPA
jgi:hypothetical protein